MTSPTFGRCCVVWRISRSRTCGHCSTLVERASAPDGSENALTGGTIAVDVQLSGVLLHTPPGTEVSESAASLWAAIRPRSPDQGIEWLVELRKLLQAIIILMAALAANAGAQDEPAVGSPPPVESGESSPDHPRVNPSR